MSDDIPIIFTDQLLAADGHAPRAVFLSAAAAAQMQQYATGGWRVIAAPGFRAGSEIDLAAIPAQAGDENAIHEADAVSCEGSFWPGNARALLTGCRAAIVKVNCAFSDIDDRHGDSIAAVLSDLGYILMASHWRDDNTYGLGSITRIDPLDTFAPRDWKHLNLIAVRDAARARAITILGRLYTGEERRIADLRLAHAIRGDHIARLEDALMAHQRRA